MVETRSQKRKNANDDNIITVVIKKKKQNKENDSLENTKEENDSLENELVKNESLENELVKNESLENESLETESLESQQINPESLDIYDKPNINHEIINVVQSIYKIYNEFKQFLEEKRSHEDTSEANSEADIDYEFSKFNEMLESIFTSEFFERIHYNEKLKMMSNQDIEFFNNELTKIRNYYKNGPNIIDIIKLQIPIEQKRHLLEVVYNLENCDILSQEYNNNLRYLENSIKDATRDPELIELEQQIQQKALSNKQDNYKTKVLKSKMSFDNKIIAYQKLEIMESYSHSNSDEFIKYKNWMDTLLHIPFGIYNNIPVNINTSTQQEIGSYISTLRNTLDSQLSFLEKPKDQIINIVTQMIRNPDCNINAIGLYGTKGTGKCLGIDTPILMFDGSIKMVQDIKIGDQLMGDDSNIRIVMSLARGQEEMFEINHVLHNETYIVNKSHILTLKMSDNKKIFDRKSRNSYVVKWFDNKNIKLNTKHFNYTNKSKENVFLEANKFLYNINENKIVDISVENYLKLNKSIRTHLQGFKVNVEFKEKELNFDPYILGLWLGDGSSSSTTISNQDSTIIHYLLTNLPKYKCYLQYQSKYDYRINGDGSRIYNSNHFLNTLNKYNLINNKHIPDDYKINSRQHQIKLLAGLIDSDGHLLKHKCGYEIMQKSNKLTEDIIYLCRSLGFQCKSKKSLKGCWYKNEYKSAEYNRISIYGNKIEEIPVLCPRKKANKRMQIKDPLVTAITVTSKGIGNYYGFELNNDNNHRFLLGNFIVTHNTEMASSIAKALNRPLRTISLGGESDSSNLTGHNFTYTGSQAGRFIEILKETQTMSPIILLDELDKLTLTEKSNEIIGTLIHLTDSTTNNKYNIDKYFSGVEFDLSKVLFIFTYNDPTKIDKILSDRLYKIKVDNYNFKEKLEIVNKHLINNILNKLQLSNSISFSEEAIEHLVRGSQNEEGLRTIKTKIKIILTRINMLLLTNKDDNIIKLKYNKLYHYYNTLPIIIPKEHVDIFLNESISSELESNKPPSGMYV